MRCDVVGTDNRTVDRCSGPFEVISSAALRYRYAPSPRGQGTRGSERVVERYWRAFSGVVVQRMGERHGLTIAR